MKKLIKETAFYKKFTSRIYDEGESLYGEPLHSQEVTEKEVNCIEIPHGATNGDMIKAMFPNCEQKEHMNNGYFEMYFDGDFRNASYMRVSKDWWNAPYKRGTTLENAEQEPCEDCVSRKAVLNTLDFTDKFLDETRTVESYKTLLEECYKNLPSVTPTHKDRTVQDFVDKCRECGKQRWIPCSERMPKEEKKTYWICTNNGYQCECRWTNVNPFWTDLTTDWHWHIADVPQYNKVIAWKPLPEPYKEESEEKE